MNYKRSLEPGMIGKVVSIRVSGSSTTTTIVGRLMSYSVTGTEVNARLEGEDIPRRFRTNYIDRIDVEASE